VTTPFISIATNRLKQGSLDRERKRVPGLVVFIEANEPRLIAFNEYVNETGDEVTVVQIHPDAASMEAHMEIIRERRAAGVRRDARRDGANSGVRRTDGRDFQDAPPAGRHRRRDHRQRRAPRWVHPFSRSTLTRVR
jgi:hypothetical protein